MSEETPLGERDRPAHRLLRRRTFVCTFLIIAAVASYWLFKTSDPLYFPGRIHIDRFESGVIAGEIGELPSHGRFAVLSSRNSRKLLFPDRPAINVARFYTGEFGGEHHTWEIDDQSLVHLNQGLVTVEDRVGNARRAQLKRPFELLNSGYYASDAVIDGQKLHVLLLRHNGPPGDGNDYGAKISYTLPQSLTPPGDPEVSRPQDVVRIDGEPYAAVFRNKQGTEWAILRWEPETHHRDPGYWKIELEDKTTIPIPSQYHAKSIESCGQEKLYVHVEHEEAQLLEIDLTANSHAFRPITFDLPSSIEAKHLTTISSKGRWLIASHRRPTSYSLWKWNYSVLLEELFLLDRTTGRVHARHSIRHSDFATAVSPYYQQIAFSDEGTHLLVAAGDHTVLTIDIDEWIAQTRP